VCVTGMVDLFAMKCFGQYQPLECSVQYIVLKPYNSVCFPILLNHL